MQTDRPTPLYNNQGALIGVFIPATHWQRLAATLQDQLMASTQESKPITEPMADWETLVQIWDFPYPIDMDVCCSECGNATQNWQQDEPRRFVLKAASIGGLVAFECAQCQARIRKNHFNDGIDVSCTPCKK